MNVLFEEKNVLSPCRKHKHLQQATPSCTIPDVKSLWACGSVYIYYIVLYRAVICELFN